MPFQKKCSSHTIPLGTLVFGILLGACVDSTPDQSGLPPDRRVDTRFSSSLGVDLNTMEARPTGLYVHDLVVGDGSRADSGDVVYVRYTGRLTSGAEFDSRLEGAPLEAALGYGYVIPGWDLGVVGMRVGGQRRLVVPPGLGYGVEGRGRIPGNATLVFDIELVDVEDRTATETP